MRIENNIRKVFCFDVCLLQVNELGHIPYGKKRSFILTNDGKEKSYLVELNIFKENAFYGFQKILLDNFPRNFYI